MSLVCHLILDDDRAIHLYSGELQIRLLTYFSNSENWGIRDTVASHSNTPMDVLQKLMEDKDWGVRQAAQWRMSEFSSGIINQ